VSRVRGDRAGQARGGTVAPVPGRRSGPVDSTSTVCSASQYRAPMSLCHGFISCQFCCVADDGCMMVHNPARR
jgi:hypothetical protein